MAVTSNSGTTTRSLNISTEQSTKSIKSLRDEIKQLRDELLNLDQGTDEYITTMVELGNKQHEIREVMTEVNKTNTDLGDNLNNMTTVIKGGVAAMQGMNSALGLMGVNLGENSELTNKLVQSMALLQSTAAMDDANKAITRLSNTIRATTIQAGGLSNILTRGIGPALKSIGSGIRTFMTTNPLGLIMLAATAILGVVNKIKDKSKEAADVIRTDMVNAMDTVKRAGETMIQHLETLFDRIINGGLHEMSAALMNFDPAKSADNARTWFNALGDEIQETLDTFKRLGSSQPLFNALTRQLKEDNDELQKLKKELNDLQNIDDPNSKTLKQISDLQSEIERATRATYVLQTALTDETKYRNIDKRLRELRKGIQQGLGAEEIKDSWDELVTDINKQLPGLANTMKTFGMLDNVPTGDNINNVIAAFEQNQNKIKTLYRDEAELAKLGFELDINIAKSLDDRDKRSVAIKKKQKDETKKHYDDMRSLAKERLDKTNADLQRGLENEKRIVSETYKLHQFELDGVQHYSKEISDAYNTMISNQDNTDIEITAQNKRIDALNKYLEELQKIKDPSKEHKNLILDTTQAIADEEIKLKELTKAKEDAYKADSEAYIKQVNAYQARLKEVEAIKEETKQMKELIAISMKYSGIGSNGNTADKPIIDQPGGRYSGGEAASGFWNWWGDAGSSAHQLAEEKDRLLIEMADLDKQMTSILQGMQENHFKWQSGQYESDIEYYEKQAELEQRRTEIEKEQSEKRREIARNENEQKKLLVEDYLNATMNVLGAVGSVFSSMASISEKDQAKQRKLQIAAAITSTIQGGINAYMAAQSLTPPLNFIVGGANMAAVLATGYANVAKMKNPTESSLSGAGVNSGAARTIASPAEIVNLNAMNDNITLPDQRVYVVESDITSAQNRVRVVEQNSTF